MNKLSELVLGLMLVCLACSAPAMPITNADTVKVESTFWAQPDLFIGLTWADMDTICPNGVCTGGGILNGYDMTGWFWAGTNDVNALLNYYIGSNQMGPGPDIYQEFPGTFAASFFADGWRATEQDALPLSSRGTIGRMSDVSTNVGLMGERFFSQSLAQTNFRAPSAGNAGVGGWFYRGTSPQIPIPATIILVTFALMNLFWAHRIKPENALA